MNDTEEEKHHYDKEKEYDTVIMPLLELVRALCIKHDIPFVFGTVVKRNEDGFVVATVAQRCKDGWVPHELTLARAMMLGNMQLVGGGISKKDIFDAMINHLMEKHDVNERRRMEIEHEQQEPVVTVENDLKHIVVDFETTQQKFTLVEALVFVNNVLEAALTLRNVTREDEDDE